MQNVGIKELKTHASEIVRSVRDKREHYIITYRGQPVGLLLPLAEKSHAESDALLPATSVWDELTRLGKEIGDGWQSTQSSAEILSEMRR
ncbi:MAG: type II toxin-antitoxin system Phd/YefM family antitoxin [Chloroflexota bacterium]